MRYCAYCKYNDGCVHTSLPPQFQCTITGELHSGMDPCNVEFAPVRHGRWIIKAINTFDLAYGSTGYEPVYECSVCGRVAESYLRLDEPIMPEDADFPNYCPNCGAIMDERKES